MSPEQTEDVPVSPASDMFSLGTVLAYAATGANPFAGPSLTSVVRRLLGPVPDPDGIPTQELRSLPPCWQHDPDRRPSLAEVLSRFEDTDLSDARSPAPLTTLVGGTTRPMATEVLAPPPPALVFTAVPGADSKVLAALSQRARRADEAEEPRAALLAHRALHLERLRLVGHTTPTPCSVDRAPLSGWAGTETSGARSTPSASWRKSAPAPSAQTTRASSRRERIWPTGSRRRWRLHRSEPRSGPGEPSSQERHTAGGCAPYRHHRRQRAHHPRDYVEQ